MFKSKPAYQLIPPLLPNHYDSWWAPTKKYVERASTVRPVYFMPWHPHVVAEGYVEPDDQGLLRMLRKRKILDREERR